MNRHTWLTRVVTVALLLALLASFGGGVLFWTAQQEDAVETLRASRFRFGLNRVRNALESGLSLGITATELPGAQTLIEQVRAEEQDILSIDVFDAQGRVLLTTDAGGVGDRIPQAWLKPCLERGGDSWRGTDHDVALQCGALLNAYERAEGGVLLRHRPLAERGEAFAWGDALLAWAGLGLLVVLPGVLLLRPIAGRAAHDLGAAAAALAPDLPQAPTPAGPAQGAGGADALPHLTAARAHLAHVDAALDAASAELDQLDAWEPRT